jgi:hypothetical protein
MDAVDPLSALAAGESARGRVSGTLFLERRSHGAVFTVRAWLRRERPARRTRSRVWLRRELCAGAWLTACFFTKFNYGVAAVARARRGLRDRRHRRAAALGCGDAKLWAKRALAALAIPALRPR